MVILDKGIGVTEEVMLQVFEKFYQGDTSSKSEGNGRIIAGKQLIHIMKTVL